MKTYITYLRVDDLLDLQDTQSDEHDEMLFIVIHQVYELWFKQMIHEFAALQLALEAGDTHRSLALLRRVRTILKTCVAQVDVLETMTPLQFESFRDRLDTASGFQSVQFRQVEAILGRRDARTADLPEAQRPSLWDSALRYFTVHGHPVDGDRQAALVTMYRTDPECAGVAEALVDVDEGLQEWRYRHVQMVERTIGRKAGTGGSSGAQYLRGTLFHPVFPDLWEIRSRF